MPFLEVCKEYVRSRGSDPVLCGWFAGVAALFLVTAARSITVNSSRSSFLSPARVDLEQKIELHRGVVKELRYSCFCLISSCLVFFRRLVFLLRARVSPTATGVRWLLLAVLLLLPLRTFLSLRVMGRSAIVSRHAVRGDFAALAWDLLRLMAWCLPAAAADSTTKYIAGRVALQLRANLGFYLHDRYLRQKVLFSLASLQNVVDVDQRITQDIDSWARCVSGTYISLFRPAVNTALYFYLMASYSGVYIPAIVVACHTLVAGLLLKLSPDIQKVVDKRSVHEGAFTSAHLNIISFAEECVMTQGQMFHLNLMNSFLASILRHEQWICYVQGLYAFAEMLFMKYCTIVLGSIVCGFSLLGSDTGVVSAEETMENFVKVLYCYKGLTNGIGDLLKNFTKCFELYALTNRLYELEEVIEVAKCSEGKIGNGEIVRGRHIEFSNVPIILPTGGLLCEKLSFFVKPGMNLLVVGSNGCGKSSMLRLLCGLWPLHGGRIVRPGNDHIYYVPQRPYISAGPLRDQITYPLKSSDIGVGESTLFNCLEMAMLDSIFDKPGITWDSSLLDKSDLLSVGEQQKLAIARLFFHRPRFAILDECSSMLDYQTEDKMYELCSNLGISLITIAHRRSVWRHHNWILRFDGNGGFMFSPVVFEKGGSIVLTKIVHASDTSMEGKKWRLELPKCDG